MRCDDAHESPVYCLFDCLSKMDSLNVLMENRMFLNNDLLGIFGRESSYLRGGPMRFISYYVTLLIAVLGLASCDASTPLCGTDLSGTTSVSGDGCQSLMCVGQSLDCNRNADDGCEIDAGSDLNNCGSCGYKCATPSVGDLPPKC